MSTPFRYTGAQATTYRVEISNNAEGPWLLLRAVEEEDGFDRRSEIERFYEERREQYPDQYVRLVQITPHVERWGKGRVYE